MSVPDSRLFHAGGPRTTGGTSNVRRRAMSQHEDFVTGDECPKNATSREVKGGPTSMRSVKDRGERKLKYRTCNMYMYSTVWGDRNRSLEGK